jgi:hypothetical protein
MLGALGVTTIAAKQRRLSTDELVEEFFTDLACDFEDPSISEFLEKLLGRERFLRTKFLR